MNKKVIKILFERTIKSTQMAFKDHQKLDEAIKEYYGEEHYSAHDVDEIIDSLDYAQGILTFERFDELMEKINIT